jgi:hypothetical protein
MSPMELVVLSGIITAFTIFAAAGRIGARPIGTHTLRVLDSACQASHHVQS